VVQAGLTAIAVVDLLLYAVLGRSLMFVPIPREVSESQREVGEGAYSLLPFAQIVAALFALSFVFAVAYLLAHLIRTRSRDGLVYTGLVVNASLVVNDTLVAMGVLAGWYLVAFSKAFEIIRINRDIRARSHQRIERRLRQAQKMEAMGRMAGGIAHDFSNILMAVGSSVELAADTIPSANPAQEDLEAAQDALETGRRLVRQLLDVARAEATKAEYVDINEFLSNSTKLLSSMLSRGTALRVAVEPGIGGVMIAPGELTQVLMNLVINAHESMPNGGTIDIQASATTARLAELPEAGSRQQIVITVIDKGTGISKEMLEHVFEPFFTTKGEQGGTGLGLATLYSIVRKAGGHVEVDSKVGRGTRFDVLLPRCQG
jgi:signal transduction histidine kinase